MADDDGLDDFFAKKDKKTKSKKSKFTTSDLMEVQDGAQPQKEKSDKADKPKKKKKSKDKSDPSNSTTSDKAQGDEEEWIEIDSGEVNYSGLKIKTLQIVDEAEQDRENQELAEDEDGDSPESRTTNQGPWAAVTQSAGEPVQEDEPEPSEPKAEETTEETKSEPARYIPPALRRAMAEGGGSPASKPTPLRRGRPREAPDIQSQMHFPTLGGTASEADRQREKEFERENPRNRFETVKSGNRQLDDGSKRGLQLDLENKFDLLKDN